MSAADYYDQVIYIESMKYREHWLDAYHNGEAHFTGAPQADVIDDIWAKWMVKKGPNGTVVLESMKYRNKYLDAHHSGTCHVSYSGYPYDDDWALWYLEDIGNGKVTFRSKRYSSSRLDAYHNGDAHITKGSGQWSEFRIYQPTIEERKELIFSYDNTQETTPVDTEYTETIGIKKIKSSTRSVTVSTEIGFEIKSVCSAKSSFYSTWAQSDSQTWSSEISRKVSIQIPAGSKKEIFQLAGYYGEDANKYKVMSNSL